MKPETYTVFKDVIEFINKTLNFVPYSALKVPLKVCLPPIN